MPYFFSPEGTNALKETLQPGQKVLLALDFDGTLAPIVSVPEQAMAPLDISRTLSDIGKRLEVAIVTGRSVTDVSARLGFTPQYVVGNHGLEGLPDQLQPGLVEVVDKWRATLGADAHKMLAGLGVRLEDKVHSLSFHYRLARNRDAALSAIHSTLKRLDPPSRIIGGKCVINALPQNAPDKFYAVSELVRLTGSNTAIFAGDDVTDEAVFAKAPPHWLTIRIDAQGSQGARFHLSHQGEVVIFLQRLLSELKNRESV